MIKRWHVLDKLIKENGFTRVAELGVKEGKTTEHLLANNPSLHMVAVDLWDVQPDQAGIQGGETYQEWSFDTIRGEFSRRTLPLKDRLHVMAMKTCDAAKFWERNHFDMVFIDADHSYSGVYGDIKDWSPLVRSGGIIAGHDFNHKWPSVQRAVADQLPLDEVRLEQDSVWWWRKP